MPLLLQNSPRIFHNDHLLPHLLCWRLISTCGGPKCKTPNPWIFRDPCDYSLHTFYTFLLVYTVSCMLSRLSLKFLETNDFSDFWSIFRNVDYDSVLICLSKFCSDGPLCNISSLSHPSQSCQFANLAVWRVVTISKFFTKLKHEDFV